MIFGDPYRFAIWTEYIPQWGETIKNGLFYLVINGTLYPGDVRTSTLLADLYEVIANDCALISHPQNKEIFSLPTEDAFNRLFYLTYPEPTEEDEYPEQVFDYCITSSNVSAFGGCFFAVANDTSLRIIGGTIQHIIKDESEERNIWEYIAKPLLEDVTISKQEIIKIMSNVKEYADSLLS
ncbi:TPA: immunity 42 family protein [Enterobacter cancerogenus]|uniref:immunity 42 family protein n=1 Tax=Enterobacter sp. 2VL TaxID=2502206 RepID=UPI0014852B7C|nr:immunity 42 family protein [Enterobacter sp. 2VL]HDS6853826.1 immunity 42 family protein [Enterobacter cancerogenus]